MRMKLFHAVVEFAPVPIRLTAQPRLSIYRPDIHVIKVVGYRESHTRLLVACCALALVKMSQSCCGRPRKGYVGSGFHAGALLTQHLTNRSANV